MRAHAHDLRAEVVRDFQLPDEAAADRLVHQVAVDWRLAELSPPDGALCAFAEKLTHSPAQMGEADIAQLRVAGFDDRSIHDATQIAAYFNYINRIADALHVEQEHFVRDWEQPQNNP